MLKHQSKVGELRDFLDQIYNKIGGTQEDLNSCLTMKLSRYPRTL